MKQLLSILSLFLFLIFPLSADTVVLNDRSGAVAPTEDILYRLDPEADLSAPEVGSNLNLMTPLPQESLQIPRDGALWLAVRLDNQSTTHEWVLENTMNVERMELYALQGETWTLKQSSGNAVPYRERSFKTRKPAFRLSLPPGTEKTLILRVEDLQSSNLQLRVSSTESFRNDYLDRTLRLGLAFGFFAALIIYNLLVFSISRDRLYLIYSLYMLAFCLNQAAQERLITQYIEPNRPYGFFWFVLFGGATVAFGLEFFRSFIDTRRHMPRLDAWMRKILWGGALISVSAFVYAGPITADILNLLSIAAMGLIIWALSVRISRGDQLALICLGGSLIYILGTAAEITTTFFPLPVTPFALSAQLYGALLQVLFLGFALGSRNRRLRLEYNRIQSEFREELEETVRRRTGELEEANRCLSVNAVTDSLTGLYNRGALMKRIEELDKAINRGTIERQNLSAAYLDLDNFKHYNDTHGHKLGDTILREAAALLKDCLRGDDLIFRMGGDEFLILMPETGAAEAEKAVQRLLASFASLPERVSARGQVHLDTAPSISVGLASGSDGQHCRVEDLIQRADEALLNAKEIGKNRYCVA